MYHQRNNMNDGFLRQFSALARSALIFSSLLCCLPPARAVDKPSEPSATGAAAPKPVSLPSMTVPELAALAMEYKTSPDDITWGKYFNLFKDVLASPSLQHADIQLFVQSNPSLSEFKLKVQETAAGRLFSFQLPRESHTALFQTSQGRVFLIPMPQLTALREARLLGAEAKPAAKAPGKAAPSQVTAAAAGHGGKLLALIGGDRVSGTLWFKGYKMENGVLFEAPELFSGLPPFFTQNVAGRASFSGNDILLTILPPVSTDPVKDADKPRVQPVGYKVLLKFSGSRYGISGKLPEDGPHSVAMNFAQALAASRPEIAKSWLIDPKLISIPKYMGLIGRSTPPLRLVPMSGPAGGGARFRLVTSGKDDLIIEVGRILSGKLKGQVAIKALFVAPPDPIAQSLMGILVVPHAAAPTDGTSQTVHAPAAAGKASPKPGAPR